MCVNISVNSFSFVFMIACACYLHWGGTSRSNNPTEGRLGHNKSIGRQHQEASSFQRIPHSSKVHCTNGKS